MIRFDVNEAGYSVEWRDLPYDVLYIVYYPIGIPKKFENGKISLLQRSQDCLYVVCPRSSGVFRGSHASNIPDCTYDVRLCTDKSGSGYNCEILRNKTIYLGHKLSVRYWMQSVGYGANGFAKLMIQSICYIPRDSIWISYGFYRNGSRNENRDLGIRIFLPAMQQDSNWNYCTSCLIPESGFRFTSVEVSDEINDCVQIVRN